MYLANSFLSLSLLDQRPTPLESPPRQKERKSLPGCEGNGSLCPFLDCLLLPAELMENGSIDQSRSQTIGMS
jgi:hypothetical protein